MELAPLSHYRAPEYPTKEALAHRPEMLRALPRRWRNNPLVLGTLAGLLALVEQASVRADEKPASRVAPIFVHGEGRGAFGCIAVNPPVFLTETEAREVIEAEAKKAGVTFTERGHTLKGVELPLTDEFGLPGETAQKTGEKPQKKSQTGDLVLTGWNPKLRVGYKFVAREDFMAWHTKEPIAHSSVSEYNMLDAAKRLQAGLKETKDAGTLGVFYDSMGRPPENVPPPNLPDEPKDGKALTAEARQALEEARRKAYDDYYQRRAAAAKAVGAEDLRSQVKDFLAWLKAQGVI